MVSLPRDYVALDFRFGPAMPDTPANRDAITRFVLQLSQQSDVFLIEPAIDAQAGPMAAIGPDPRIHRIDREVRPSEILAVQSAIIAGARAMVGTFGPMSCLGQALGRITIGVRAPDGVIEAGLEELAMVPPEPESGTLHLVGLEALEQLVAALATPGAPELDGILASVALAPPPARARLRAGVADR
jgi:hypothetical protein